MIQTLTVIAVILTCAVILSIRGFKLTIVHEYKHEKQYTPEEIIEIEKALKEDTDRDAVPSMQSIIQAINEDFGGIEYGTRPSN